MKVREYDFLKALMRSLGIVSRTSMISPLTRDLGIIFTVTTATGISYWRWMQDAVKKDCIHSGIPSGRPM